MPCSNYMDVGGTALTFGAVLNVIVIVVACYMVAKTILSIYKSLPRKFLNRENRL